MTNREQILLDAIRAIAAGRKRNRKGDMQRLGREECVEAARVALRKWQEAAGE